MLKYRVTRSSSASNALQKPEPVIIDDGYSVTSRDSAVGSDISSRPEPRSRDTLSVTSRGSHGGSNSSLSSNSAFGSARKKRPAPRPPIPFLTSESPVGSNLGTPSSSVAQSPLTLRSRKTKRAPLPSASTPSNHNSRPEEFQGPTESPINLEGVLKDQKDEENRRKQYLADPDSLQDKSSAGRWKRRKGLAPQRPVPQKRTVKALPLSEIKRELNTIEIQQQGLEKQGVRLEQIIRDKCETPGGPEEVPIEVEDLILQLFELVNEKNELFRRQTELMYLKRQQRLEEEQADLEYQIRCLMLQPGGKSDSDKLREEMLIKRLVETVDRRNEIIERLEMDRKREVEEDQEISSHLNLYSAKREEEKSFKEDDKKDKKKKHHKKLNKLMHAFKHKKEKDQKAVTDKDIDETEVASPEKEKKKRLHLF